MAKNLKERILERISLFKSEYEENLYDPAYAHFSVVIENMERALEILDGDKEAFSKEEVAMILSGIEEAS